MGCAVSTPEEFSLAETPQYSLRNISRTGSWSLDGPPKTATDLSFMRSSFWESQTTGQSQIWEALRLMSEAVLEGDIHLAETIAEAAQIRLPHGDLSICYDTANRVYKVPRYCYCNPNNLVSPKDVADLATRKSRHHVGPSTLLGDIIVRIASTPTNFEQDVVLENMTSDTTIGMLKRELHEQLNNGLHDAPAEDANSKVNSWKGKGLPASEQRIFYRGAELRDDAYLQGTGIVEKDVLQLFIRQQRE